MIRRPRATTTAARFARAALVACACSLLAASTAGAQATLPDGFEDELVLGGLSEPVGMAFLPDGRLLVIEQRSARVLLVRVGQTAFTVGNVPDVQNNSGERGLLGIAVDPQWPARPYLYFHYTSTNTRVRLSRFTVTGDLAGTGNGAIALDAASRFDLITDAPDNAGNHNGGSVRFDTSGMLIASFGEDANQCAAQDTSSLRGVLLRLDVSGLPAGPGTATKSQLVPSDNPFDSSTNANQRLVWALGLRNPFRIQVDRMTGEVFIGDVGENQFEEVNRAASGGRNFGWPYREALTDHTGSCPGIVRPPIVSPVFFYDRDQAGGGQAAVITAGRYRPAASAAEPFPAEYSGDLFASDYYGGMLWRLEGSGDNWSIASPVPGQPNASHWGRGMGLASDYAVGPDGALWYLKQASTLAYMANSGSVRRIRFTNAPPDSNPPPPPSAVQFDPPYPVPSAGPVNLSIALTREARIRLVVYDVRGQRVREVLRESTQLAGPLATVWDGRDDNGDLAPNGVYFARLDADGDALERRIVLIR